MTPASRSRSSARRSACPGIVGSGTPEQIAEWVPQCFGTPDDLHMAAFAVSEPDAGTDVSSLRTRAVYDEAKDEWVLNGTKTWITNGGITQGADRARRRRRGRARAEEPRARVVRRAAGHARPVDGPEVQEDGHPRAHTAEVVLDDVRVPGRCLLGGKEKLDARLARAREGQSHAVQAAMSTFEASRPLVGAQALGIARGRRTSTRSSTRRNASRSAGRSS